MKTSLIAVAAVAAAGALYLGGFKSATRVPSDLRDAVSDSSFDALKKETGAEASDVKVPEPEIKPFYVETGSRRGLGNKGYVAGIDPSVGAPAEPVKYITIAGGKFTMGTDSGEKGFEDAKPIHEVAIRTFDMSKTAVTVEQYAECVGRGQCTEPNTGAYCNWRKPGRELHPVNCVDWDQANQYARFKGARLPSESEWEYAARSGGRDQKYPWGNAMPGTGNAVTNVLGHYSGTMPVCSKPAGNTAQGLCDMAGNVWQWVQDKYQDSYKGAPADGGAFEAAGSRRLLRGGSFDDDGSLFFRAGYRGHSSVPGYRGDNFGFRLVR